MQYEFSREYLALLREFEGLYLIPYLCPAGCCTIGYGTNLEAHPRFIPFEYTRGLVQSGRLRGAELLHTLRDSDMRWTKEQAEEAMLWELQQTHADMLQRCPVYAALRDKGDNVRADALLDMGYNMGVGRAPNKSRGIKGSGLLGFHATLPMIDRGEYARAAENLKLSNWYRQTGRRARAVCSMIATGRYPESLR